MTDAMPVNGHCDRRFAGVADAFAENFRSRGEAGAAVAVTLRGAPVVDLWGGFADSARTRPWAEDTLVCMMSVAKAVTALCAAMAVDRGLIGWDEPVARYWPEFAAAGKGGIPVRWVLDHRAGLAAITQPMPEGAAYDREAMTAALAAQAPLSAAGRRRAPTIPSPWAIWLGELITAHGRAEPRTFPRRGGLRAARHRLLDRPAAGTAWAVRGILRRDRGHAVRPLGPGLPHGSGDGAGAGGGFQHGAVPQSAEIPSINGIGTARGVARLFDGLAAGGVLDGKRLLSADVLAEAATEQWLGREELLGHTRRMALGFALGLPGHLAMGPSPRAFGHTGAGGAIGFADPDAGLGFAYAPNHMYSGPGISPRLAALVDALYEVLA